ncbi:MAG: hypothetical protein GY804_05670 [Alphaproteobacteria bacterium]|nr:hypothetical protein [Alphaproteobacteria bacterium]
MCLFLFALTVVISFAGRDAAAISAYRIAYSKNHNIEVFADTLTEQWCESIVHLRLIIKDDTVLQSDDFPNVISKIVKVAVEKCSLVNEVDINGYDIENNHIYKSTINVTGEWEVTSENIMLPDSKNGESQALNTGRVIEASDAISDNDLMNDLMDSSKDATYRYFFVNGWMPKGLDAPLVGDETVAFEHDVYTKDKQCKIRYNRKMENKTVSDWYLNVKKGECSGGQYLHGDIDLQIMIDEGVVDGEGKGFFSDGFYTGKEHWNTMFMSRYAFGENHQRLNFLLDVDATLGVYYVGYLHSDYNARTEKFSRWHGCSPLKINAVTENAKLFVDPEKVARMIEKAGYFADLFCSEKKEFSFFATHAPKGVSNVDKPAEEFAWRKDKNFIYGVVVHKNESTGKWEFNHDLAANNEMLKIIEKSSRKKRKQAIIASDHKILSKATFKEKLAYIHNSSTISDPKALYAASLVSEASVDAAIYVKITKVGIGYAVADWPYKIYLDIPGGDKLSKGWYLVSGEFMANSNHKQSKELGTMVVSRTTKCEQDECAEVNNVTSIINRRYQVLEEESGK